MFSSVRKEIWPFNRTWTRYSKVLSFIKTYRAELAKHTQMLTEACFLIVHWSDLHSWLTPTGHRSHHPYDEVKDIACYLKYSPPPTTRYRAQDQEEEVKALLCWLEELIVAGNDAFLGLLKEVDTLEKLERGGDLLQMLEYWEQRQERIQAMKPWAEEVERAMWKTRRLLGSRVSGDEKPWGLFDGALPGIIIERRRHRPIHTSPYKTCDQLYWHGF